MSSLNLHLDFMDKNEPPVRFVELTAEEELQITQDSNRLLEQLDEDLRILDRMCSAFDNMIIIKKHYDEYGPSPALEALVGDIKEYLGISLEADEQPTDTKSDDSSNKEKSGGFVGAMKKIWDWICGIFTRVGEWLNIVDKKVESDKSIIESYEDQKLSNYYSIKYIQALYDGKEIKSSLPPFGEIEKVISNTLDEVSNNLEKNQEKGIKDIENLASNYKPYQAWIDGEVQGKNLKPLFSVTWKLYRETKGSSIRLGKKIKSLKSKIDKVLETNKAQNVEYLNDPFENLKNYIPKYLAVIKLISHRSAVSISSMAKALRGKAPARTEEEVTRKSEKEQAKQQHNQELEAEKEKAKKEAAERKNNK